MKKQFIGVICMLMIIFPYYLHAASAIEGKNPKSQRESKEILKNIYEKDTYKIPSLALRDKGNGKFLHEQKAYNMDIVFDSSLKKITLRKGNESMSMTLPQVSKNTTIKLIDGQIITSDEKSDIVTQSIDGGVRQMINVYSADAEKVYDFPLTFPEGYYLIEDGSGNILVQNASGSILSHLGKPWAKDANGIEIPTHYEIRGNTLRQFIDFDEKTIFPVVADPIWCGQTIASTSWIYRGGTHPWSLSITPTTCGKWSGVYVPDGYWQDLLAVTPVSVYWNKIPGTTRYWSMYNQLICHVDYAAGFKTPWNLEPTRPSVGYSQTVLAMCNPN